LTHLRGKLVRCLAHDAPSYSRVGASGKPGAVQNHIERLLGYRLEESYGGEGQEPVPPVLAEAVMQLAAHWYENREAVLIGVTAMPMPLGLREIIREYREWSF
ncbi:head-tail connector protein, partial [Martelella sp. AD-3]